MNNDNDALQFIHLEGCLLEDFFEFLHAYINYYQFNNAYINIPIQIHTFFVFVIVAFGIMYLLCFAFWFKMFRVDQSENAAD